MTSQDIFQNQTRAQLEFNTRQNWKELGSGRVSSGNPLISNNDIASIQARVYTKKKRHVKGILTTRGWESSKSLELIE